MKVRVTFMEEALGSTPAKEDLLRDYIAKKAPDAEKTEEEVAARGVDAVVDDRMTIFPKLADGTPFFWDYQVKGFLRTAGKCW